MMRNPPVLRVCGRTIFKTQLLYGTAFGSMLFGACTFLMLPEPSYSPERGRIAHPETMAARKRALAITELVERLPEKSGRQKLEDAVDGAVQTHEIGFPASK